MKLPFYIVDVFAEQKYAGNQLAVFRNAAALSTEQMQCIAREMNYSETTFILSEKQHNKGFPVRIFTPTQEVPFAGHPTLGTVFILQQEVIRQAVDTISLNLQVGQIPVMLNYQNLAPDVLWMRQNSPTFGQRFEIQEIAAILNLSASEIDDRYAIEEVSTGIPFIIVPLKTYAALRKAKVNKELFFQRIETTQAKAILVFCPEPQDAENHLRVRVFADGLGVPEDPATGSANGCLAGYLVQHEYFGTPDIDIRVEQGYEIGRPSLLMLQAQKEGEDIRVSVGGRVILVAKGEFV
jgi:trans-2,3-dihydro-3-hydroxyanthranilate isomerase